MKVLRVNTEIGDTRYEDVSETWQRLGGRGLSARILLDEVPPWCEPLGAYNKLILAPGLLAGHTLSSCDRISVSGKSPLTGRVRETNGGGITALRMAWLGLHVIIIEGGPPPDGNWKVLFVDGEGAQLEDAGDLVGLGLQETSKRLTRRYGRKVGVAAIGPAGERRYLSANVAHIDKDRNLTRFCGRGGLGAVMGSKHLKAIVLDQPTSNPPPQVDPQLFREASRRYLQSLKTHHMTSQSYPIYGTAAMSSTTNAMGCLPTRNFSAGVFEGQEHISGEAIHDLNVSRGGVPTHSCMPGCIVRCSNIYYGPDGKPLVTPLEYETIAMMGANLGLDNPDDIARLNAVANDVGVDTIETGVALGIVAEAGLMSFGDGARALELMEEIRGDTLLGRVLGNGADVTGKVLGVKRTPVARGMGIPAYEPRAVKSMGVTYATSPVGPDHTAGFTVRMKIDHSDPGVAVEASRKMQYRAAGWDSLGVCVFGAFGFLTDLTMVRDLVNARYGWGVGDDYVDELGRETILLEREFNRRAGFTSADDRIPEWMSREKLPPTDSVFDVPGEEMEAIFDE